MRILRWLFHIPYLFKGGLYYRMRSTMKLGSSVLASLPSFRAISPLKAEEHIVVVGHGISALTFLEGLKTRGHKHVTVVGNDKEFGGKCVLLGCMPMEFVFAHTEISATESVERTSNFVNQLHEATSQRFMNLDYKFIHGYVKSIQSKSLHLDNGQEIAFDRLVLATGNKISPPTNLPPTISLTEFWNLKSGSLCIVSNGQPAALTLADVALQRGLKVSLLETTSTPLDRLLSYQYFKTQIINRGLRIIKSLDHVEYNHLLYWGQAQLNLPQIDGNTLNVFDVDFTDMALKRRQDIFVLGDASGFLSATEAELSAIELTQVLYGERRFVNSEDFYNLPLRLHGHSSLALAGKPWTLLARNFSELDFNVLGASMIKEQEGKLWYIYNERTDFVESIHLCHPDAGALIAVASALMEFPINHPRWLTCAIHPSSFEIFKVLAVQIRSEHPRRTKGADQNIQTTFRQVQFPSLSKLRDDDFFKKYFSQKELQIALLDPDPALYLALSYGIKSLSLDYRGEDVVVGLSGTSEHYKPLWPMDFSYERPQNSKSVLVRSNNNSVMVHLS